MSCEDQDCDKRHVKHKSETCIDKNSPAGRIILRGGNKPAIAKESSFPAYADKDLREKVSALSEKDKVLHEKISSLSKDDKDLRDRVTYLLEKDEILREAVNSLTQRLNSITNIVQEQGNIQEIREATEKITQRMNLVGNSVEELGAAVKQASHELTRVPYTELEAAIVRVKEMGEEITEYRRTNTNIQEEARKAMDTAREYSETIQAALHEMRQISKKTEENLDVINNAVKRVQSMTTAVEAKDYETKTKEAVEKINSISEQSAHKLSNMADKASEYIKEVVNTGEKVVSDYFGKFKKSVDELEKEAQNVEARVHTFDTVVNDAIDKSENKIMEEAMRIREKTSKDLLLQASAVQASIAASADVRLSSPPRSPPKYEPHPVFEREMPKYVKDQVKTSQQLQESIEKLKLEEIQAVADSNAARDLRSKLETTYNLYNEQVAHYKNIQEQILRLQQKNNRTDEDQLNLARASDAGDRSAASIDELRSQIKSLETQYSRIATLAASELELVKKHSAEVRSKQVSSDVAREKAIQEKAKIYSAEAAQASSMKTERPVDPSEVKATAMKVLMKAGIKFGTPEYNSLMAPLRQAISRGEAFDLEELKLAALNMQS